MPAKKTDSGKNVIDIADFFTTSREKEGVWYEPVIEDVGIGIEFKILGYSSDQNVISAEVYRKEHEAAEKETDPVKKNNMERDAVCKRIASLVTDIRGKDGNEIRIDGKPLVYSDEVVRHILYENIDIRTDLFKATLDTPNFQMKKR